MNLANHSLALDLTLPITEWFVDETLYSLCCRFHYVSGNALASTSARQLFSHPRYGTQHDFASRINVFVQRTQGMFGANAEEIVYEHTILPYYLPWRTRRQAHTIVQQLSAGHAGNIKSLLGLPSSRIRANHPLKACPMCMQADKRLVGVSYWHLTHQLPGVLACPTHACALMMSVKKATGVGRFLWYLPHEGSFYPLASGLEATASNRWLERLSNAAIAAFRLAPDIHIDPDRLVAAYREALNDRALLRGNVQIALRDAAHQYLQFTQALNFPGLDIPLPTSQAQARLHLTRLLALPQRSTHPLRHLLIILWLFENWDQFWKMYTHAKPSRVDSIAKATDLAKQPNGPRTARLLSLIQSEGLTVSAAARQIGIAVQTAQAWASAQGVRVQRRSKTPSRYLKAMINDLRLGRDKAEIADRYSVSVQTVSRLLKTEPNLLAQWQGAHHTRQVLAARRTWQRTIARNPQAILKELRALQPGCYTWLYRHDRLWLTQSLAHAPKSHHAPTGVDWCQRDAQLVALLSVTVQRIKIQTNSSITLQQIYQSEPSIKPYLNKLKRLPLTRQLLEQVCSRSFSPKCNSSK